MQACAFLLLLLAPDAAAVPAELAALLEDKAVMLKEIEDWKVLLPDDLQAPLTKRFIPPLHQIKLSAEKAATPQALAATRLKLEAWKSRLTAALYSAEARQFPGGAAEYQELVERKRQALVRVRDAEKVLAGAGPDLGLGASAALDAVKARVRSAQSVADLDRLFDNGGTNGEGSFVVLASPMSFSAPQSVSLQASYTTRPARLTPESLPPPPSPDQGMAKEPGRDYTALRAALVRRGVNGSVIDEALRQSRAQGVDPLLVLAMMQAESSFRTSAVSEAGAIGLMQIMPETGRGLGVTDASALFNVSVNIRAGIKYMKGLWDRFSRASWAALDGMDVWNNPGVKMVVAAYNAGPGAVKKYGGVPPYHETQKHVIKVLTYFLQFKKLATPVLPAIIV